VFVAVKAWKGTPLMGRHLPLTVTEACALTITAILAHRLARSVREFEDAVLRLGLLEAPETESFDTAQSELYREVRRARRQRRPLALAALKLEPQQAAAAIPRVIEEVQKRCAHELITRRLANVLVRSVEDEGWVIQRGDHFLVLLPESNHEQARELLRRVEQAVAAELGVELRHGLAAFPDEEITFTGLVERAEAQMRGEETPLPEHGWRLPAVDGETVRVNGNGNGRLHRVDAAAASAKAGSPS
jgi:GGDEF domain-containing protein